MPQAVKVDLKVPTALIGVFEIPVKVSFDSSSAFRMASGKSCAGISDWLEPVSSKPTPVISNEDVAVKDKYS